MTKDIYYYNGNPYHKAKADGYIFLPIEGDCKNCKGTGSILEKRYDPDDEIVHECGYCDGNGGLKPVPHHQCDKCTGEHAYKHPCIMKGNNNGVVQSTRDCD